MGKAVAVYPVVPALFAAEYIVFIAQELTPKDNLPDAPEARDRENRL